MPRAQRNALAEIIIAALHDRGARATLAVLTRVLDADGPVVIAATAAAPLRKHRIVVATRVGQAPPEGTGPSPVSTTGERSHIEVALAPAFARVRGVAAARTRAACDAAEAYWRSAGRRSDDALADTLHRAVALFAAGLYFEVHEELEPVWRRSGGTARVALQGLIQIAVALHHAERGNVAGARRLLAAGRAKVEPHAPVWEGVAIDTLLADLRRWERACLDEGRVATAPRLVVA